MKRYSFLLSPLLLLAACTSAPNAAPNAASDPGTSATPQVTLHATPGGPSGWSVRYTAVTSGFSGPVQYDFSSCGAFDALAGEVQAGNTLTCHHFEAGERTVSVSAIDATGVVATDSAAVTIRSAEVPYEGTWRWTLQDEAGGARSGYFTITRADIYGKGRGPFSEFASRGEVFECTRGPCEAAGEAAIFFSQTGLPDPAYAFNLRLGGVSPEGDAVFGLTAEGAQRFVDGGLEAIWTEVANGK